MPVIPPSMKWFGSKKLLIPNDVSEIPLMMYNERLKNLRIFIGV